MRTHLASRVVALTGVVAAAAIVAVSGSSATAAVDCPVPAEPMRFSEAGYVDRTRAGGEPIVFTHPDGSLLYGSHAGTTHFFAPESADEQILAFGGNYTGQTYYYYSEDHGLTWEYVDRVVPPSGTPASGFSDPEFAYDLAGNVYVSEINLANVSMSKSVDSGRTYEEQNFFAQTVTDRQWTEGDEEDVVYIIANAFGGGTFPGDPAGNLGHYLYKSKDGGQTFSAGIPDGDGLGDIRVDKSDGTLYEAQWGGSSTSPSELKMRVFRNARADDLEFEDYVVAEGVSMLGHWPTFDLDPEGNLYITWDESGVGDREAGVYYSYSTDRGLTWGAPVRLDTDAKTDIWPWLAVGDTGKVGVAWFQADEELPAHNAQTAGEHGWRVMAAQSLNGLGCGPASTPGFRVVAAVDEPIHSGTICQGGTACQAQAIDRRLGDYFSVEIAGNGMMVLAYSDTREGGPVALPGFTRQIAGSSFLGTTPPGPQPGPPAPPPPAPAPQPVPGGSTPSTGGGPGAAAAVLLGCAVLALRLRRRVGTPA